MGYSVEDHMVRVDFFKPSGKWYCSEAVAWTGGYTGDIHTAFRKSLMDSVGGRYKGLDVVCLEPYHEHSHPIQIKSWGG